jgi:hypothetical protein
MNVMNLTMPQSPENRLFTDIAFSQAARELCPVLHLGINNSDHLIRICKPPKIK